MNFDAEFFVLCGFVVFVGLLFYLGVHNDSLEPFTDYLAALGVPQARFTPVFSRGRADANSGLMLDGSAIAPAAGLRRAPAPNPPRHRRDAERRGLLGPQLGMQGARRQARI